MQTALKTAKRPETLENEPLLADLNPEQRFAVTHASGPLLLIAGAGTGKTTVIARRAAWLIAEGKAKPDEILALTFTDKAANEMVERIDALLPMGYTDLWVSTFHAFCQRLLQEHGLDIGLPNEFRLLNETDAYLLVRRNLDRFNLDYYRPLGNPGKFIHALLKHFSRAKDEAITPEEYLNCAKNLLLDEDGAPNGGEERSRLTELANAYHDYEKLLLDNGCVDLGDLLSYALELFKKRKNILEHYRRQFKYVIVDEFQDTNRAQYELLKMLVPGAGNILVVGDDDQSIYKFRGASVSNILQFKDDFPSAGVIVLTKNYRSKQNILDLTHRFIQQNNPNRLEAKLTDQLSGGAVTKQLIAERIGEAEIRHCHFATLEDEVAGVVDRILVLKEKNAASAWNDFCILVRSNGNADDFCRELERRGIPHQFLALKGLYAKPIVLDCLAYFSLLDNYHESAALYRILSSSPYQIDSADLVNLMHEASKKALSLYEILRSRLAAHGISDASRRTIDRLLADIAKHAPIARSKSVSEVLIRFLFDSGYADALTKHDSAEAKERLSHVQQFLARLRRFEAGHDEPILRRFMEEFAIERDAGEEGGLAFDVENGPDMVRIMTVHAAKGLEFPFIFVVNMVDKKFPSVARGGEIELPYALIKERAEGGEIHLEEERRLCYVAMTRAKDGLFFTSAGDYGGKVKKKLSRFLTEMGFDRPETAVVDRVLRPVPAPVPAGGNKAVHAVPAYFSFTQLAAYAKCPLQYKFAHVLRIPVFGKAQLSFGRTMHVTLERFMKEFADRSGTVQPTLFGGAPTNGAAIPSMPVSRDELMRMYEDVWQDDWYDDRAMKENYRQKGREMLNRFYDDVAAGRPKPLFLEKGFKISVGRHWVRGKIDRIDRLENGVEIIDYKTGSSKSGDTLRPEDKKQLMLYQIAVGRVFGFNPEKLTYHYLENGTAVSFLGSEKEIASFEEELSGQIDRIRSGDFEPTPGQHCRFCDFARICEFRSS